MPDESSPALGIPAAPQAAEPEGIPELEVTPEGGSSVDVPIEPGTAEGDEGRTFYGGKYQSLSDLENAHKELEQKLGSHTASRSQMSVADILTSAGLENEDVVTNWQEHGELSEDQYGQFAKAGYNKDLVNTFLAGQQAMALGSQDGQIAIQNNAAAMAGGEDELQNLLAWASTQYPEGRVEKMNERLRSAAEYEGVIKEILYDYRQATASGFTAPLVTGQAMPNTASGYETVADLAQAIRQSRDKGMTEAIKRRIANTPENILQGIDERG